MEERYPLTVFYDGECPICAREIALVKRLHRRERLAFIDFAHPTYDPSQTGLAPAHLGRVIHARWADGTVITGVEVFRAVWAAVGWSALARISRMRAVDRLLSTAYGWFARNRLRLTGRAHVEPTAHRLVEAEVQAQQAASDRCAGTCAGSGQ